MRTHVVGWVMLWLAFALLAGCGGGGGGGGATGGSSSGSAGPGPVEVTRVVVEHTLETRTVPALIDDLRFTGLDSAGNVRFGPRTEPKAARIVLEQVPVSVVNLRIEYLNEGVVRGLTTLPVSLSPGQEAVVVDPPFLDVAATMVSLATDPEAAELPAGTSRGLAAWATFNDRTVQDMTTSAQWSSSAPGVATVDGQGRVRGVAPGEASITARVGVFADSTTVTVTDALLVSLAVEPADASAPVGIDVPHSAVGLFTDGSSRTLTTGVTWTSSDASVASVSSAGVVSARKVGTADITAAFTATGASATSRFTVTEAVLQSISLSPTNPSVPRGLQQQFEATGRYSDGTTGALTGVVQWGTDDAAVATVSGGLVTARAEGATVVRATHPGTGVTGSTSLQVTPAVLVQLTLSPLQSSLPLGLTRQFTAAGTFSDSSVRDLTASVAWSSSDPSAASISNAVGSRGLASGLAVGTTQIRARDALSGVEGSTSLEVTAAELVSIGVTPFQPSLPKGLTRSMTATGVFTDNSTQDLTEAVTWGSSNPGAASVDNSEGNRGVLTAVAPGQATVIATHPGTGIRGETLATVTEAALVSISVTPAEPSVPAGREQSFTAAGAYTDGSTADLTTAVTWSSSDGTVASISNAAGTRGRAAALEPGTSTITALHVASGISGSTLLTVTDAVAVSLQIAPRGVTLPLGRSTDFAATATFSDGSLRDVTQEATWSAAPTDIASASNQSGARGRVTALAQGAATLQAVLPGTEVSDSVTVTVVGASLDSLEVSPADSDLAEGLEQQFTGVGVFSDGSRVDLTAQLTWTSANPAIAEVSNAEGSRGLARGVAVGATQIQAADGSTGVTGFAAVRVTPAVLKSLRVDPAAPLNAPGTQRQYRAFGTYSDGSVRDLTSVVGWTSSDTSVAAVGSSTGSHGLASVTGSAGQSATITARHAGTQISGQATQHVGLYAFTANLGDESLTTWRVDPATGALTPLRRLYYTYGSGGPTRARVDATGRYLLVSLRDADKMSVYSIRPDDGMLTEVPGSPVATGDLPQGFEFHPSNRWVVVGNWRDDTVGVYRFDPATGALTQVGAPVSGAEGPLEFCFDASGTRVYVGNDTDAQATGYAMDPDTGTLTPLQGSPYAAGFSTAVALSPLGGFAYVAAHYPGVYIYSVDAATGALTYLSRVDYQNGRATTITAGPNPRFLYALTVNQSSVHVYSVDDDTGGLTLVPGAPFSLYGNVGPRELAFTPDGRFAYTANQAGATISVFRHDAATGAMAEESLLRRTQAGAYSIDLTP